jgi:hypothetical protein
MPFGGVKLVPGVNVERTPTLNEAGVVQSQLIRYRDGLLQKYGGWTNFYPFAVAGVPRDLHAWDDLNQVSRLAVGTTAQLGAITGATLRDLTPQTKKTDFAPNFSTTVGSASVLVVDANITNVSTYDSAFFNTPVAVGGVILSGLYPIDSITGAHSYRITAATPATSLVNNGGAVPTFTTVTGSSNVSVTLTAHGLTSAPENTIVFPIPTVVNGITIDGLYTAASITSANAFVIQASAQATAAGTVAMNSGNAEIVYYITLGPPPGGVGFGIGGYGLGGYGTGVAPTVQQGTAIAATDWTLDNWGQLLLACPEDGGIYYWDPTGGFENASLIASAPIFNAGIFVSTSAQILVAYGSTITEQIGVLQDPMLVQWCDSGNFFDWTPSDTNLARNFRIPIGSRIVAGLPVSNQNLIWTDLDLWIMNFIGFPNVYGFNMIGAGAGAASSHAVQKLRGGVHWMGTSNFYRYAGIRRRGGAVPGVGCGVPEHQHRLPQERPRDAEHAVQRGRLPLSVAGQRQRRERFLRQVQHQRAGPAVGLWLLPRSAWIDQNVFGPPIGANPGGVIYQHESGNDAAGQPMVWSYTTGYFRIAEGEDYAFVDRWLPDFKFGAYGSPRPR